MHIGTDGIDAFTSTVKRFFYSDVIKCAGVYYFNELSRIPHGTFYKSLHYVKSGKESSFGFM